MSYAASDAALTTMKKDPDLAFLVEVSAVPPQQALRHQHQAFRAFFAQRARRRHLDYKCQRYGRQLVTIDRWYPSSKTCSACGHLLTKLSLASRHWTCPSCGARHDRDVNAAAGQAVTACGADVRHPGPPWCNRL